MSWTLDTETGVMTITGSGAMSSFESQRDRPWYDHLSSIKSLVFEEGITLIGTWAFDGCKNLKSVSLPNTLTYISMEAFANTALTSVDLSGTAVRTIDTGAFSGCASLTTVTLPESLTTLEWGAFSGCNALTAIHIPKNVKKIGTEVFRNCYKLTSLTVDADNPNFRSAGNCLINVESATLIAAAAANALIPGDAGISAIGDYAFSGQTSLVEIVIPESVVNIGKYAFYNCSKLERVGGGSRVEIIEESAFQSCKALTEVPHFFELNTIERNAFLSCSSLREFFFGANLTTIGESAFRICSSLISIVLRETQLTEIAPLAFSDCSGASSIYLPNTLSYIHGSAFKRCSSVRQITLPASLEFIAQGAFAECTNLTTLYNCSTIPIVYQQAPELSGQLSLYTTTIYTGHQAISLPQSDWYQLSEATCTMKATYYTEQCEACHEYITLTEVGEPLGHYETVLPEQPPTLDKPGLTEGLSCYRCGIVFLPQEVIPPLNSTTTGEYGETDTRSPEDTTENEIPSTEATTLPPSEILDSLDNPDQGAFMSVSPATLLVVGGAGVGIVLILLILLVSSAKRAKKRKEIRRRYLEDTEHWESKSKRY